MVWTSDKSRKMQFDIRGKWGIMFDRLFFRHSLFIGTIFLSVIIFQSSSILMGSSEESKKPTHIEYVNLEKYAGLWYEIAKIPNRFQRKCSGNTTAFYSLREDGRIDVVNRCFTKDGKSIEAKGIAKVVDNKSNARLKVSFVRILWFSFFWGDYWILALDENYTYAIVGTPNRKYGWILSRQSYLSTNELDQIFSLLREKGYDPDDFEMTTHSPP